MNVLGHNVAKNAVHSNRSLAKIRIFDVVEKATNGNGAFLVAVGTTLNRVDVDTPSIAAEADASKG